MKNEIQLREQQSMPIEVLKSRLQAIEPEVNNLNDMVDFGIKRYGEVLEYFCEDKMLKMEEFFGLWHRFITRFNVSFVHNTGR